LDESESGGELRRGPAESVLVCPSSGGGQIARPSSLTPDRRSALDRAPFLAFPFILCCRLNEKEVLWLRSERTLVEGETRPGDGAEVVARACETGAAGVCSS
jgi:hypothetical protein